MNMSTAISVGCGLTSQPETSVKTLCFYMVSAWVPTAMSRSAGRPWKPPSVPENCSRCEISTPMVPFCPSTAQSWWEQGFWHLGFSELCHHCSNPSSCSELSTHRVSRAQPRLCSSCWEPGRPKVLSSTKVLSSMSTSCPATKGLCQAMGTQPWAAPAEHPCHCQRLTPALTHGHLGSSL